MVFRKLLFASFIFFSIKCYSATVQGVVLLNGSANHGGVNISFIPKSQSAVATSAISLADGSYSAAVQSGVYEIKYSKDGYQEVVLIDQFISVDVTLSQVTLPSKPVVHITGDVQGTWVNTNDYVIDGNINVPLGTELVIEEGTLVKFSGFYRLIVSGKLTAIGSKGKEIIFTTTKTSKARGDWSGITVSTSSDTTRLVYCQIEYGASNADQSSMILNTGNLIVKNSLIRGSAYGGIYNQSGGFMKVEKTEVTDAYFYGIVSTSSAKGATLYYNNIHHIDLIGLSCQWSVSHVIGNSVYNTGYQGIQAYGDFLIERNLLFNNPYGVFVVAGKPVVRNNTIYKNGHGIGFYDSDFWHPTAIISSNIIFQNNGWGIYCEGIYKPERVEYNLISGNPSGVANRGPVGVGTIVTTNVYGYPADTYMNIFNTAGFFSVDSQNENYLYLLPTSAAIDGGDPALKDADNSAVDCGAIPFQKYNQVITFNELTIKTYGDPDFELSASVTTGLPITFISENEDVAVIDNGKVKIVSAGKANIIARQVGNINYKLTDQARELIVQKANQVITFPIVQDKTLDESVFSISATASSQLPVAYSVNNDKLSVTLGEATLLKAGRVIVQATQAGNQNYNAADPVEKSFCIRPAKPVISVEEVNFRPILTSSNSDGNQWMFNETSIPNATDRTWEATKDGMYTVISKVDDCVSEVSERLAIVITGTESMQSNASIEVFPNPASHQVTIQADDDTQSALKIELLNLSGQILIRSEGLMGIKQVMNLEGVKAGVYVLRFHTKYGILSKQLIKY